MSVGQTIRLMATSRLIGRGMTSKSMTSKSMTSMNMTTKDMTNKRIAAQGKAKSLLQRCVNLASAALLSVCSLFALPVLGQPGENEIAPLREAVSAFSEALAGGLGLNAPGGLFGTSVGSVQARYLFGQGVYLEVRSPLASRRQRPSFVALDSTLRQLQLDQNPFSRISAAASVAGPAAPEPDTQLLSQMTEQLQQLDYELIVGAALSEAQRTAERLRSLEGIDQAAYRALQQEFDDLRQRFADNLSLMSADETGVSPVQEQLDSLRESIEQRAGELKQQLETAQADYESRWLAERDEFEVQLVAAACRSAGELAALRGDQSVVVVLMGLGDGSVRARPDRIHVIPLAALRRCERDEVTAEQVAAASVAYSY